ncbi:holin [Alkalihalobacillus pseudalcaliphilus]|uniref:holin n=1 Tax=Alkalihalobacillus pseudalcaliphilus TaxID=79884 RepID=UPI00064D8688|nr:holin [Alkalihalobacillus pseudalcaliphilus]KMK76073.1 holin [Alkalihalobacillus pseudalcaliphilus]
METILIFATILSPVILALVQLVKRTVSIPKNYIPLLSFVVGLAVGGVAYPFTDLDLALRLWAGGIAGLSATGLFEIGNDRKGFTKNKVNEE